MKIALIGGVFDDAGGRKSGYVTRLQAEVVGQLGGDSLDLYVNGGPASELESLVERLQGIDVALWFADVPNHLPKLVGSLKARWPKMLLVTSKRNLDGAYPISELLGRALKTKSNLLVEMTGGRTKVESTVLDPLGSSYCTKETDIGKVAGTLLGRLRRLRGFGRVGSEQVGEKIAAPDDPEFFALVREQAEQFHAIIHGVGHERMMGNASFRCAKGFPSVRSGNLIFVSRRDIDKRFIAPENFVAVDADSNNPVRYYGAEKPSVDTPIQVRLYQYYPRVRYMLHSHTYIDGAPTTSEPVPCGAVEEADQVFALFPDAGLVDFCLNLRGHGSIVLASSVTGLRGWPWGPRPVPEPV
jgi:hypothetical protein